MQLATENHEKVIYEGSESRCEGWKIEDSQSHITLSCVFTTEHRRTIEKHQHANHFLRNQLWLQAVDPSNISLQHLSRVIKVRIA